MATLVTKRQYYWDSASNPKCLNKEILKQITELERTPLDISLQHCTRSFLTCKVILASFLEKNKYYPLAPSRALDGGIKVLQQSTEQRSLTTRGSRILSV